jgi:hypothetical protein
MTGVESELARLDRRIENPDRKRGRRVNPFLPCGCTLAGRHHVYQRSI